MSLYDPPPPASAFSAVNSFTEALAAAAAAPLTEIIPAAPADATAALGFALAWTQSAANGGMLIWTATEASFVEGGAPSAEGVVQLGLDLDRLLIVRTRTQTEALWAAEQALAAPHVLALCTIDPSAKPLNLTATRRLLLAAEKHKTRCLLLRLDAAQASAAWTRWRVAAAPSLGAGRELGSPRFAARLERNRKGAAGFSWIVAWSAHEHAFVAADTMDGAMAAAPLDRSVEARRHSALR